MAKRTSLKSLQIIIDSLNGAILNQADLLSTTREKSEFLEKKLAEREKQMDEIIAAHAQEIKAHKATIDFLLSLYKVKDPRVQSISMGDQEVNVKFSFGG
jgi:hypothetical protein